MIRLISYLDPLPEGESEDVTFLAGPTTDWGPDGIRTFQGTPMSAWRADLLNLVSQRGGGGTFVIPEFFHKGSYREDAASRFGQTPVPPVLGGMKATSLGVIEWEEAWMAHSHRVVAHLDVRDTQPGAGLNARPEIQGLLVRAGMYRALERAGIKPPVDLPWVPESLILSIPPEGTKTSRFRINAVEFGIPWVTSLREVADELINPSGQFRIR